MPVVYEEEAEDEIVLIDVEVMQRINLESGGDVVPEAMLYREGVGKDTAYIINGRGRRGWNML